MLTDDDFMLTFVLFPDVPIPEIATVDQLKHTVTLSQLVDFSRLWDNLQHTTQQNTV